eukprot:TRINITY_DN16498_c0_g1_i1.p1 TRINITY_DN16498_c0_g1~~TRINITY_DN16498_c0_g1_i1.p1  ORF type:complete len:378 (-),score=73.71 TRINITY_DN16498_c0_g1_i1:174-1307(-)
MQPQCVLTAMRPTLRPRLLGHLREMLEEKDRDNAVLRRRCEVLDRLLVGGRSADRACEHVGLKDELLGHDAADRLETSQRLVGQLCEELSVANAERESLASETARLREEVGGLRSRLATAERGAYEAGDLRARLATAEERGSQEVADLQVRVATAEREAHDASEMRTRLAKAERLAQESVELRVRLATAEHEAQACSELRGRLATAERGVHELGELRVRLATAERGAQDAHALRVRLAAAEREVQDTGELRARLSTLEHCAQEAGELRARLAAAERGLQEVEFLRNRLMIRDADVARLERRIADLEGTASAIAGGDNRVTPALGGNSSGRQHTSPVCLARWAATPTSVHNTTSPRCMVAPLATSTPALPGAQCNSQR